MYLIGDELKEFLESGVACHIGTASVQGKPEMVIGWGPRVLEDRQSLAIFVEPPRAGAALANMRATGHVAIVFADPVSYRSVQLKGKWRGLGPPGEGDDEWVRRHREGFIANLLLVGDSPSGNRNIYMGEIVRLELAIHQAFDQTPGPDAGHPL